jgi:hypothetical protein
MAGGGPPGAGLTWRCCTLPTWATQVQRPGSGDPLAARAGTGAPGPCIPRAGDKLSKLGGYLFQLPGTRSIVALGEYTTPEPDAVIGGIWQYGPVS